MSRDDLEKLCAQVNDRFAALRAAVDRKLDSDGATEQFAPQAQVDALQKDVDRFLVGVAPEAEAAASTKPARAQDGVLVGLSREPAVVLDAPPLLKRHRTGQPVRKATWPGMGFSNAGAIPSLSISTPVAFSKASASLAATTPSGGSKNASA